MSREQNFSQWIEESVTYVNNLDALKVQEWKSLFTSFENFFADTVLPSGQLIINEEAPKEDFSFWLKRALKREHAQASVYNGANDQLVERSISWRSEGAPSHLEQALLPLTIKGKNRALFLDRDGIINVDGGYINKIEDVTFVKDIEKVIKFANDNNIKVIVLTNQSGVGRGYYSENDVLALHQWMGAELLKKGVSVDAWYYSPFHPDASEGRYKKASYTRKPLPGMALIAAQDHNICLKSSAMIGDKVSDVLAQVDMMTFLLQGNYPLGNYPHIEKDHLGILERITGFFNVD